MASESKLCHWDGGLGKVWTSDEPEPGELPSRKITVDLRATGRDLRFSVTIIRLFFAAGFFNVGLCGISRVHIGATGNE